METQKIYRIKDIMKLLQVSKASVYRMMDANEFPRPIKISRRLIGWTAEQINQWLSQSVSASLNK